ncbi:MAG: 4-(cytidine 5'-diphospho)-2-C-methyl-D-erythritol kinase, partial [Xanthomonadales bacterium]|nr:4-(cytidine 5'-diphospho)-2-C-methyl-D-erythritol kinase [Xanthomonadales bacterium]
MSRAESDAARWPAPAKINLFLHVLGRRADGYHELQTVFQLLDWGDELHIEATDSPSIERTRDLPGVSESDDLGLRAASLLQAASGTAHGARIGAVKQIPPGSGLGGASSDAATVLHVLNRLWGCGLDLQALARLGRELGADVPVFVHGHSAWAEGVGERLEPMALGERHYVLLFPGVTVSTAEVFAEPALPRDTR